MTKQEFGSYILNYQTYKTKGRQKKVFRFLSKFCNFAEKFLKMDIFEKGNYKPLPASFKMRGIFALEELNKFQQEFEIYDTDTTINEIRDAIVAGYLGFDLLNFEKHGFDAKSSEKDIFLEVKQCSIFSQRLGGTWNDTNE